MSTSFFDKTEDEIKQEVRGLAIKELGVTELKSTGALTGLVETCANLTAWIYKNYIFPLKAQIGLDNATGVFLDSWGNMLGVARKPASKTHGTIKGIAGQSGIIQAGNKITFEGTGLYYLVETEVQFSTGDFTFTVVAENTGSAYNLSHKRTPGLVNNVTGIGSLSLAEDWIITHGAEIETDESYRTRIRASWLKTASGDVPVLYESEAMSITGVAEAKAFRVPQGYGSTRVVVRRVDNTVPNLTLLQEVRERLERVGLVARQLFVESVKTSDLTIAFKFRGNITREIAEKRVLDYFLNLKIGQKYSLQDLYNLFDDMQDIVFTSPKEEAPSLLPGAIYHVDITATKESL